MNLKIIFTGILCLFLNEVIAQTWENLGPVGHHTMQNSNTGVGRINCIWVNQNETLMYAGANGGGLWKRQRSGSNDPWGNWIVLTDDYPVGGVQDLAVDPKNPDRIFIACGFTREHSYATGLFRTTDGGNTWEQLPSLIERSSNLLFTCILIDPENVNTIYALHTRSLIKSTDGGNTWVDTNVPVHADDAPYFTHLRIHPTNSDILYIAGENELVSSGTGNPNEYACWITRNGGSTWSNFANPSWPDRIKMAFATTPNEPDKVFAVYWNFDGGGNYGYFTKYDITTNAWTTAVRHTVMPRHWLLELEVSPDGDIYTGGVELYKSSDNGNSFSMVTHYQVHDDIKHIFFPDPSKNTLLYLANDGGVYKSDNPANNSTAWASLSDGLITNEIHLAITEDDSDYLLAGTWDCGTYQYSNNQWTFINGGDGGRNLIDYSDKDNLYIQQNYRDRIKRKPSGSSGFVTLHYISELFSPFAQDPVNPNNFWATSAGSGHLAFSSDKGVNFTEKPNSSAPTWATGRPHAIGLSKVSSQKLYYSIQYVDWDPLPWKFSCKLYKTMDQGASWTNDLIANIPVAGESFCRTIEVHPADDEKLWIGFDNNIEGEKVYFSSDGGTSWTNISEGLPNYPVQVLKFNESNNILFAGTDVGVYYKDGNGPWEVYGSGCPKTRVYSLDINSVSNKVFVGTFGRGAWVADLPCYNSSPLIISQDKIIEFDEAPCNDIIVESGATLTIKATITMPYQATITVRTGGKLVIDQEGIIENADIKVEDKGYISLVNGGKVTFKTGDGIDLHLGGTSDLFNGEVIVLTDPNL